MHLELKGEVGFLRIQKGTGNRIKKAIKTSRSPGIFSLLTVYLSYFLFANYSLFFLITRKRAI